MNFYALTEAQTEIDLLLEESQGEITQEIEDLFDKLDQNKVAVMAQAATVHDEYKAREAALKEIIKGFQTKLKTTQTSQKNLKKFLLEYLEKTGQKKIEYNEIRIRRQASPPSVLVTSMADVPDKYKRANITVNVDELEQIKFIGIKPINEDIEVDKKAVMQSWKDSKKTLEITGTEIKQSEHVRIS